MLLDLNVEAYKQLNDREKQGFENDMCIPESLSKKIDRVDFGLLVSCLNKYRDKEIQSDVQSGVFTRLLSVFKQSPARVVEYIDIKQDGRITRAEFTVNVEKCIEGYSRVGACDCRRRSTSSSAWWLGARQRRTCRARR